MVVPALNFIMRSKSRLHQNPEIDVSFTNKAGDLEQQESRLHVQILRVHAIEKLRAIQSVWQYPQNELCDYFTAYAPFPQHGISTEALLDSPKLKLVKSDNKIYFGEVDRKRREGRGVYLQRDGRLYEGQFYNNQKSGAGVEIYSNGNLYLGDFLNNKKHGRGTFYWFALSSRSPKADQFFEYYDGDWWGGLPDGRGVHQKITGDLFTGTFKNGLKHGEGEERYGNGDYYAGEYINGMPEGFGEYRWADGSNYKGDFKQGDRSGYGVWQANRDRLENYRGHYSADKKTGYGVYTWDNGWQYKGNFDNDYRNGYGELYDSEGELQYKGFWDNGEQSDREGVIATREKELAFNIRSTRFPSKKETVPRERFEEESGFRSRELRPPVSREDINQYATLSNFAELNLCRRPEEQPTSSEYFSSSGGLKRSATAGKNIRVREGRIGTSINRPLMMNGNSMKFAGHR